jgi:tRNA(Ile)-lysidine synthase
VNTSRSEPHPPLLTRLPVAGHYCIAYSGGVDSHVLLHAMTRHAGAAGARLTAVHVDHGLQLQSGDWAVHRRDVCAELGVSFVVLPVDARGGPGESPEAAARHARYRALADWLPPDAVLLTAQHRDDQAETLLLQLFRGAGPRGLAAMPGETQLGAGRLVRPLLHLGRTEIVAYARRHRLRWIEDPSNTDTRYDRNLLRRQLLPSIRQRWPGIDRVLARAAMLQADQAELAAALADIDLANCAVAQQPAQLEGEALHKVARARQRNLLRYWIAGNRLPVPSQALIDRILDDVLAARPDAGPVLRWPGAEVRRYRRRLYIMPPLPPAQPGLTLSWNPQRQPALAMPVGTLSAVPATGRGLRATLNTELQVGFRQGGEVVQPAGRGGHHALKKLFQEWQVPEWQRARVPLLFRDGVLIAVAGYCVTEGFQAMPEESAFELHWQPATAGKK